MEKLKELLRIMDEFHSDDRSEYFVRYHAELRWRIYAGEYEDHYDECLIESES